MITVCEVPNTTTEHFLQFSIKILQTIKGIFLVNLFLVPISSHHGVGHLGNAQSID